MRVMDANYALHYRKVEICLASVGCEHFATRFTNLMSFLSSNGSFTRGFSTMSTKQKRTQAGFTLVELLVVIAIIGILVGLLIILGM